MRSPAVARQLEINWIEAEWPTAWNEKYGASSLPLSALSKLTSEKNKPSLVYIVREMDEEKLEELELKMFGSEEVALASRFFRCYKILASDINDEKIKAQYLLKKGPTLIVLDAKGNEILKNKKRVSKTWVYSKLKKQFANDFGGKMTTHIKRLSNWLDDLEKADDRKADAELLLRTAEERSEKKETKATTKRLAKARSAFDKVEEAFDKVKDFGKKLSAPALRATETAKK